MKKTILFLALLCSPLALAAQEDPARKAQIERGQYIVHHVAMCINCHTPRNPQGELVQEKLLRGAPIPVPSPFASWNWATRAPAIAGLGGFQEKDVLRLLTEGIVDRTDRPPKPPMPTFGMRREDAEAIVAYLKSLP